MTSAVEFSFTVYDPRNPSFGGTLTVTNNDMPIEVQELTFEQASFVLGALLRGVDDAQAKYPGRVEW